MKAPIFFSSLVVSASITLTAPSDDWDFTSSSIIMKRRQNDCTCCNDVHRQDLDMPSTLTAEEKEMYEKATCDPTTINLADYNQWVSEVGYWIGEYTFLKDDGTPFTSSSWPYRYDSYKGFITGNIRQNAYRQRNVFLYPPQAQSVCDSYTAEDTSVLGSGTCGINGMTKLFEADQKSTTCGDGGNIEGLYAGMFPTKTTLIGDNALLYQVMYNDALVQSQLTTITKDSSGQMYRTRSAQGFDPMTQMSNSMSYYRERKVSKDEFYAELSHTIAAYNVRVDDLCKADPSSNEEVGSIEKCVAHLENSWEL